MRLSVAQYLFKCKVIGLFTLINKILSKLLEKTRRDKIMLTIVYTKYILGLL